MLKRYQVLLADWQEDYIKLHAQQYDWSFSESLRLIVSVEIINWVAARYPQYKPKLNDKILVARLKKWLKSPKAFEESFHKQISELYFEARKAAEFILSKENPKRKLF